MTNLGQTKHASGRGVASGTRALLDAMGRRGPWVLLGGVGLGLIAPFLARAAYPLMGAAVFVFTFGAFMKVDGAGLRAEFACPRRVVLALAWITFGVPLVAFPVARLGIADPDMAQGFMLAMLAPPVGSAAAIAAMLGLRAPLALLATTVATILSPVYLPAIYALFSDAKFEVDAVALTIRLVAVVGGAWMAAVLVKRLAGGFVQDNPHCMTGVSVLGLLVVALSAMRGMQDTLLSRPGTVAMVLGMAFAANAGFQALGTLLFRGAALPWAMTVGLVSGNRNVTLVWAAAAPFVAAHPDVEMYLAMSVLPIFIMPALTGWLIARLIRPRACPIRSVYADIKRS